ncbi:MAG: hypothetical protein IH988_05580 [Planctomycetes bacterium]|nr:hypothetical protein [Planctomycetota bacterium]
MYSSKTVTMAILGFALTGGLLIVRTLSAAGPPCDPVSGFSETAVEEENGPFVGFATLEIRGEEFEFSLEVSILGEPVEGEDGTLHLPTSHVFTLDDESSFTTIDKAVADPIEGSPGLYTLNSNMKITSGTGMFDGASGSLHAHGELDLVFGTASLDYHGVICD